MQTEKYMWSLINYLVDVAIAPADCFPWRLDRTFNPNFQTADLLGNLCDPLAMSSLVLDPPANAATSMPASYPASLQLW